MEKLNFLPLWEIERLDKRKRKNSYIFLFVLMVSNFLLITIFIFNKNNIRKLKIEKSSKMVLSNAIFKDRITAPKKNDSLKSYQWYNREISKEIILKELIIKKKEIVLNAKTKNYNDYLNVVNYIENKCKVKDVSVAKFDENYLEFTITLEANYE